MPRTDMKFPQKGKGKIKTGPSEMGEASMKGRQGVKCCGSMTGRQGVTGKQIGGGMYGKSPNCK